MVFASRRGFAGVILVIGSLVAQAQTDIQSQAKTLVNNFMARKFDKVELQSDAATREELPESKLLGIWDTLES